MNLHLRSMRSGDIEKLVHITSATNFFRPEEVDVAVEVLTKAAEGFDTSGYIVHVATKAAEPVGYVCFGPTPLTRGTWDIYWAAVDSGLQGQGIGSSLFQAAESKIARQNGRLIMLETSSQPLYKPTRRFFLSQGYKEVCRVPDFYDIGDAKVIYSKAISAVTKETTPP